MSLTVSLTLACALAVRRHFGAWRRWRTCKLGAKLSCRADKKILCGGRACDNEELPIIAALRGASLLYFTSLLYLPQLRAMCVGTQRDYSIVAELKQNQNTFAFQSSIIMCDGERASLSYRIALSPRAAIKFLLQQHTHTHRSGNERAEMLICVCDTGIASRKHTHSMLCVCVMKKIRHSWPRERERDAKHCFLF